MKNVLEVENLSVAYQSERVLEDLSYQAGNGIHAIIGPNGCGKSTLLKSVAGMVPYQTGRISIQGWELDIQPLKAKQLLYYMPDKPNVYPFMTGRQFLQMIASIKRAEISNLLMEWIESIRLTAYLDTPFGDMSFGTRRKFMLSGSLISSPALLLLDEPFNGLDKDTKSRVLEYFNQVKEATCIVLVSHELQEIDVLLDSKLSLEY